MRNLIFAIAVAASLAAPITVSAFGFNCGIPPIPPIGCRNPQCVCDQNGRCQWVFDCN